MFSKLKHQRTHIPTVLIAVPCHRQVFTDTMTCVVNIMQSSQAYRSRVMFHQGGLIHRARNTVAEYFLKHEEKPDYLLFVDDDMVFQGDALEKLLSNGKDIVTGNAFTRKFPVRPVVGHFDPVRLGRINTLVEYKKDELQQVESCGMAFTLISRKAMEQVTAVNKHPFNFIYFPETDGELPEDSAFCWWAKQAGIDVWLDSRVQIGHIGSIIYDEVDFDAGKDQLIKLMEGEPTN